MNEPDRLSSLEEAAAHNAAAIDDISAQMADQWAAIRRLEAQLDRVIGHLQALRDDGPGDVPTERPPPHY